LQHYELYLDANDFTYAGRWVTPPFNARRFDTWFFLVDCPGKQEPYLTAGELVDGEWITAQEAYNRWLTDSVVAVPPTLHALRTLAGGVTPDLAERFLSNINAQGEIARRITFRPNYICFPVRTPTRPPASPTIAASNAGPSDNTRVTSGALRASPSQPNCSAAPPPSAMRFVMTHPSAAMTGTAASAWRRRRRFGAAWLPSLRRQIRLPRRNMMEQGPT
jgi:hypothetical protein